MLHYKTIVNNQFDNWIVMIHGAGGSIEVWFRQVADYARHFNLLLVDLAGHGGSSNEAFGKGFNFNRAAEQVMEVVNHLKIEKGHSSACRSDLSWCALSQSTILSRFQAWSWLVL